MPPKTLRSDWLTQALGSAGYFVSGLDATSAQYVPPPGVVTLRFVAHHPRGVPAPAVPRGRRGWLPSHYDLMMGFVVVELPDQAAVDAFQPSRALLDLAGRVEERFRTSVAVVAFPTVEDPAVPLRFRVRDAQSNLAGRPVTPEEYAVAVNRLRNPPDPADPRMKEFNRTQNDLFQDWTRTYLSGQVAVNDVDALKQLATADGNGVVALLELKRSSAVELESWSPYTKDVPNYLLVKALTRASPEALDFTLHYQPENPAALGVHVVTSVSWDRIVGFRKIIRAADPAGVVAGFEAYVRELVGDAYTSRR